jgi:hypothetical protein
MSLNALPTTNLCELVRLINNTINCAGNVHIILHYLGFNLFTGHKGP